MVVSNDVTEGRQIVDIHVVRKSYMYQGRRLRVHAPHSSRARATFQSNSFMPDWLFNEIIYDIN